jgi:hypothetical protein
MKISVQKNKYRDLLLASRITGSVVTGLFSLIIIPYVIEGITREESHLPENNPWEGVLLTVGTCLLIIGYIISWKSAGIGGLLMVLAGLTVCVPFILIQGNMVSLIFGLPFTVAGLQYIIYWNDLRKSRIQEKMEA